MLIIPPISSSPIGSLSTSCLRKLTIHFRRPTKLKEKKNFPYKGEYGFDWLRDEYIYPLTKVYVDKEENSEIYLGTPNDPGDIRPLCKNPKELRDEYLYEVIHPITPYGQNYYPAWLSIFAFDVNGNANSTMHNKGIYLTLQLDEIDEVTDDGTEIILKPGRSCLKITPNKISISSFIKAGKKTRTLGKTGPTINYYELESAVNITCQGDTLDKHEEIKVFAKLGQTEVEVGKLMVYQNKVVHKANIIIIKVITKTDDDGNKISPNVRNKIEELYKYHSFNQAMIQAEVVAIEDFDLVELEKNPANEDVKTFFTNINKPEIMDPIKVAAIYISDTLCSLYKKYGKHTPPENKGIDESGHKLTYLFLTNLAPVKGELSGYSTYHKAENRNNFKSVIEWEFGNASIIFERGLQDEYTLVHEISHSFSLFHSFNSNYSQHSFYYGYTENYMDYVDHLIIEKNTTEENNNTPKFALENNLHRGKMYSFFKWQWDLMRRDKSIED